MRKKKEQTEINDQEIISVGHCLEAGRKAKGLSIEAASKSLCITKKILTRLEKECDELPRDVYTVGFVRSYATYLGLDADALVSVFRGNASISLIRTCDESKFPSPLPQAGIPRFKYILASVALVALIVIGVHNNTSDKIALQQAVVDTNIEEPQTPTLISDQIPDEETTSISEEVVDESAPVKESSTPSQVVMKSTADSWVQVSNPAGKVLISRVFKKGDSYPLDPKLTDFKIHTGNAGGITFVVDDHQSPPLGKIGEIRKDLSFNVDKLRADSSRTVKTVSADAEGAAKSEITKKSLSGQANRPEKNADDSKSAPAQDKVGESTSDPEATETVSVRKEIRTDKTVTETEETISAEGDVAVGTSEADDEEPASKE